HDLPFGIAGDHADRVVREPGSPQFLNRVLGGGPALEHTDHGVRFCRGRCHDWSSVNRAGITTPTGPPATAQVAHPVPPTRVRKELRQQKNPAHCFFHSAGSPFSKSGRRCFMTGSLISLANRAVVHRPADAWT